MRPRPSFAAALARALFVAALAVALVPRAQAQGGVPLWTNVTRAPSTPAAIAVDGNGDVFVVGETSGSNPNTGSGYQDTDIGVVAYSGDGVILWTNTYVGPWDDRDSPVGIAVDKAGNVFVAGFSVVSGTVFTPSTMDWDYVTLAYSGNGVPLWTNYYDGPGNHQDRARAFAVDSAGNVFTTGFSNTGGDAASADFATVAYSGAGVPLWTNRYDGPSHNTDEPSGIAVDSSGNVFVAGDSLTGASYVFATLAYSGAGVPLWTNLYLEAGAAGGAASAIAVDSNSGNVFVTGSTWTSSSSKYATVAYSRTGMPLWTNRYQGKSYSIPSCIAVDGVGNVIVTGSLRSGSDTTTLDYGTVAYSGAGVPLWTNRYDGPGHNADEPSGVAVDSSGNVFVTGYSSTGSSAAFATLAYSRAGVPLWTNRYVGPGWCGARGVAVDKSGNVFVTGTTGIGGVTIKYSSSMQPRLDIQRLSNQVVLSWNTPGFILQAAPTITGTFTNITGATSPYTNSANGPEGYFRLASP